jgi:cation transport ATPase
MRLALVRADAGIVFYTWLGWKLNPLLGAAAMSMSSVFVVSNASY